jgi:pimeloyl-ACP methyl ester carboxylesterase
MIHRMGWKTTHDWFAGGHARAVKDRMIFLRPPSTGRQVASLVPGARFEVLDDAGHFPHLQAPATLVGLARGFFDE